MTFFQIDGDSVSHKRVERELKKALSISEKRSANGRAGSKAKALKNKESRLANGRDLPEPGHAIARALPLPEPITPPTPPSGRVEGWAEFKAKWGASDVQQPAAEKAFAALSQPNRKAAIAGIRGYVAEAETLGRGRCVARKYLEQHRWKGLAAAPEAKDSGPPMPGFVIRPGTEQWEAWHAYVEKTDNAPVQIGGNTLRLRSLMDSCNENNRPCRMPSEWPPEENAT
jgi:hypothetical protein